MSPQNSAVEKLSIIIITTGGRVGSVVIALDWRSKGGGFESRQEHRKNFVFFRVKNVLTRCRCAQPPLCIGTHTKRPRTHVKESCSPRQSLVDYGNMKITRMHLYPRRRSVGCPSGGGFKTVTYATPPAGFVFILKNIYI